MTTTKPETHAFQAETRELLDLMIHSLYTHREIFLRELVSNASDALDKLRFAALTDTSLRTGDEPLRIRLEPDSEAHTLVIDDNGIGMTKQEVIDNIGTIARSGTRGFLEELRKAKSSKKGKKKEAAADAPEFIGQFGVGFYSSFMVAEKVVLETRRAGTEDGVRWTSTGDGEFTVEDLEKQTPGTCITLHLRETDEDETQDFTDQRVLRQVVKRYSDFVGYPVQMDVEHTPEGGAKETRTETLNSQKPLWTRPKGEISQEEHHEFYKHLSHDWTDPLATIHFQAEGTHEYTALLYLPARRPADILDPTQHHSKLSLYVKRMFVMQECEELLPSWLRFVRGLVDSSDLPLNVSRETLQHNRQIRQINNRLVKKVVETMGGLLGDRRREYTRFWSSLGSIVKEGLFLDGDHREELLETCLFQSSAGQTVDLGAEEGATDDDAGSDGDSDVDAVCPFGYTTLAEYVARKPLAQQAIYYVTGPDRTAVEASPHIESARAKGYEVLFLVDPVDEWVLQRLTEYQGTPLKSLDRGEGELEEEESDKSTREARQKELAPLLEAAQESLDDYVKAVRLSARLKESPAVLVSDEGALSPQLEQALRAAGQEVPTAKRILELNPDHPVLGQLQALQGADEHRFHLYLELLHGQALLAEGSPVPDPARFARLVTELMAPAPEPAD